jgi:hypothetical protein
LPELATSPDKHALNLIFQKFGSSGILDGREHTAAQFDWQSFNSTLLNDAFEPMACNGQHLWPPEGWPAITSARF